MFVCRLNYILRTFATDLYLKLNEARVISSEFCTARAHGPDESTTARKVVFNLVHCRSATYNTATGDCRISDMDRHTVASSGDFTESQDDQYLENNCVDDPVKLCDFQLLENRIMKTVDSVYQVGCRLEEEETDYFGGFSPSTFALERASVPSCSAVSRHACPPAWGIPFFGSMHNTEYFQFSNHRG